MNKDKKHVHKALLSSAGFLAILPLRATQGHLILSLFWVGEVLIRAWKAMLVGDYNFKEYLCLLDAI